MNGVLSSQSVIHLLQYRLADPWWSGVFMGLGTGLIVPSPNTQLADVVEAIFPGYVRQPLDLPWTYPVILPDGGAISAHPAGAFWNSDVLPSPSITCWFWYRPVSNQMVLVGNFPTPVVIAPGGTIRHTPSFALTTE